MSDDEDDDHDEHSYYNIKEDTRETAKLLPPVASRMDSFEAEITETSAVWHQKRLIKERAIILRDN